MNKKIFASLVSSAFAILNNSSIEKLCNQYGNENQFPIDAQSEGNRTGANKSTVAGEVGKYFYVTKDGRIVSYESQLKSNNEIEE